MNKEKYLSSYPSTVQIQLADYTSRLLSDCVDKDYLKSATGYNVEFDDWPNTTVTLGDEDVVFSAYFPITINLQSNKSRAKLTATKNVYFSVKVPVRLKKIYDFSYEITDDDRKNLTFVLLEDSLKKKSYSELLEGSQNFNFSVIALLENPSMELVRITDGNSLIRGEPYVFEFVRMNRPPALDWIHKTDEPFDIKVPESTKIVINPKGYDPDEDYYFIPDESPCTDDDGDECMSRNYSYFGWKETEDYYFNYTCCIQKSSVMDCLDPLQSGGCVSYSSKAPHNWTPTFDSRRHVLGFLMA